MASKKEKHIIDSWMQNAKPWISAISKEEIESRKLVTNQAILRAILAKQPRTALDIGCGEGWLARALSTNGIRVHGIDVVPELVKEATRQGGATFQVLSYEDLAAGALKEKFDVAVCNFSLLGNESAAQVFQSISRLLTAKGFFLVQTIHPISAGGEATYQDGWREGSWAGFNSQFTNPPPWYFRTLEAWKDLFANHNIHLLETLEPLLPGTETFASLIFVGQVKRKE